MGCVTSKQEHVNHPRIFHVWNVDGDGRHLKPGRIEVTDSQLILCQKGNIVVKWPLKSLRRYGFDSEVFSFECGRRCSTGPGVYAFKCRRAQALFTILQECINNSGASPSVEDQAGGERAHPAPPANLQGAAVGGGSCPTVDSSGYLEPITANSHLHYPTGPRAAAGSPGGYVCIHSAGVDWPTNCCGGRSAAPTSAHHYANAEAGRACVVQHHHHHYVNSPPEASLPRCCPEPNGNTYGNGHLPGGGCCCVDANTNYAKLDDLLKQEQQKRKEQQQQPFYVNVKPDAAAAAAQSGSSASSKCVSGRSTPTGGTPASPPAAKGLSAHCYANLGSPEEEEESTDREEDQVNYAVLDLDQNEPVLSPATAPNPGFSREHSVVGSPARSPEGYAQIDFDRTVALSNSANPCPFDDDSMRKTRHNAVIPCPSMSA